MIIVALLLHLHLHPAHARVTCGIHVVSVNFSGTPGYVLSYDGEHYRLPIAGTVEVLANPRLTTYEANGRVRPLSGPIDDFGTMHVTVEENAP